MKIIFATSSKSKFEMAKRLIDDNNITLVYKNFDFVEPRDIDVVPIVKAKAIQAWDRFKRPLVVNDSGIFIESLNGFPGTQVKFALQTIGLGGILALMRNYKNKRMSFKYAVAYADKGRIKTFEGEYTGSITNEMRGDKTDGWSEFIRVFIPDGFEKTPAEMNKEELDQFHEKFKTIDPFYKFLSWIRANK